MSPAIHTEGLAKASFVGPVIFTPSFDDGRRDIDSVQALSRIGKGANVLQVRLLGQDGIALQEHNYQLATMTAPSPTPTPMAAGRSRPARDFFGSAPVSESAGELIGVITPRAVRFPWP